MAGEIEEPFRLDFRVDPFHSGSISFGRFENEELCWERRSSFSHNRYLEEVEKCSKPGSVTQKKAYFEARFKKKGFPFLTSPECRNDTDYQTSENDISEKMCNDEEIDHMNASTCSAQFDENLDGSVHGGDNEVVGCETQVFGHQFELSSDGSRNMDCVAEHVKANKSDDAELRSSPSINSESVVEMKENVHKSNEKNSNDSSKNRQSSSPKEKIPSKLDPRLAPRVSVQKSRGSLSGNTSKGSANKVNKEVRTVPVRSKAEKKILEEPNKCLMHKTTKYERASKTKGVDEMNRAKTEPRNRTIAEPQSSIWKVSGRASAYQSANRVKPAVGVTKPGIKQDISRSSFKSSDSLQKMKELSKMHAREAKKHQLQSNTQEKPQARMNQMRKSISFKSSSRSMVTSDSSASSLAVTSKHQPSQAAISLSCRKKEPEKEKLGNLRKHKVPEGNQIHKGKAFDGNQKTRIQRSTDASFSSSSRTTHMAVHVAS